MRSRTLRPLAALGSPRPQGSDEGSARRCRPLLFDALLFDALLVGGCGPEGGACRRRAQGAPRGAAGGKAGLFQSVVRIRRCRSGSTLRLQGPRRAAGRSLLPARRQPPGPLACEDIKHETSNKYELQTNTRHQHRPATASKPRHRRQPQPVRSGRGSQNRRGPERWEPCRLWRRQTVHPRAARPPQRRVLFTSRGFFWREICAPTWPRQTGASSQPP